MQGENILAMWVERSELKELAQFIHDNQQSLSFRVRNDLRIGVKDGVHDLFIGRLGLCVEQPLNEFGRFRLSATLIDARDALVQRPQD
ncbi:MAG: hypothetical protein NT154_47395 [Verrucomicrobia bacterium]|nr:hypothetical protein [Verrucomicrobiota bacterium]